MFKKRLLWHLYPPFLLIIIISMVGVAWYASHSLRAFYFNNVSEDLESRAHLIEKQLSSLLPFRNFEKIDALCKRLGAASSTRITVIMPLGQVIADSDEMPGRMENHSDRPEFQNALEQGVGKSRRFSETLGKRMIYLAIPIKQQNRTQAVLRTSIPVSDIDKQLAGIYRRIFWAVIVTAILTAVISLVISRRITRPVEQMKETAGRFASGRLDSRVPVPKSTELAELARVLNEMAERLNNRINAITKQRNESEAILTSMVEGVVAVDSEAYIMSINPAAAEFLKISPEQFQGKSIEEAVRNTEIQKFVRDTLTSREPIETDIVLPGDGNRSFRLHGTALSDENGERFGALIVLNDMTLLKRLENVRRDFVANVSHELKTPITSIKGFIETLLDGAVNEPEQARRFLEIISRHTDRLNAIVDDLLSLSRLEEDTQTSRISFEEKPLRPVIVSAIEMSKPKAEERRIEISLDCAKNIKAKINPALLEQAVMNLVDNSVKYTEPSGKVHITARRSQEEITITVQDNGRGIDKEHLERIFERFYVIDKGRSRKLGGTGLGLAIVKHIAQVHKGRVTVESKPSQGSSFTIHLPASNE